MIRALRRWLDVAFPLWRIAAAFAVVAAFAAAVWCIRDTGVQAERAEWVTKMATAKAEGIDLLVTSTLRDFEAQAALYAQGRTAPGNRVTNAGPGDSFHNYGLAFDVVPLRNGKPVWGTATDADQDLWERVGEIGESVGLEWAGRWKTFREYAHFQARGLNIAALKAARQTEVA